MAFKKPVTWRGVTAEYFRLEEFRWSRASRQAAATFSLHVSQAAASSGERPLEPEVAVMRISGEAFDTYLGPAALGNTAKTAGADIVASLYTAARDAGQDKKQTGKTDPQIHVICDYGKDVFADAKPV